MSWKDRPNPQCLSVHQGMRCESYELDHLDSDRHSYQGDESYGGPSLFFTWRGPTWRTLRDERDPSTVTHWKARAERAEAEVVRLTALKTPRQGFFSRHKKERKA